MFRIQALARLFLLLPLSACASSSQVREARVLVSPQMLEAPSVHSLFGYRERLRLSSEQITALDSLYSETHLRQQALLDSLYAHSQALSRSERPLLAVGDEGQPFLEEIRRGHEVLEEAVEAILTPEQREEACRINPDRGEERRERTRREGTRSPSPASPGASRALEEERLRAHLQQARRWRWCGEQPAPS